MHSVAFKHPVLSHSRTIRSLCSATCLSTALLISLVNTSTGCRSSTRSSDDGIGGSKSVGDSLTSSSYDGGMVDSFRLSDDEKRALLDLAKSSVESWVRDSRKVSTHDVSDRFPNVNAHRACFVTLRRDGQLRGCIGSLEPYRALVEDVADNAVSAAVRDPRFEPVRASELAFLQYSISVLDLPRVLTGVAPSELPAYMATHRPGVIIEYRGRRSTFLPSVWEELPDPSEFLSRLCLKQGAPSNCWSGPDVRISTYGSIYFGEGAE